jgi:hypothetical protein
VRTSLGGGSRWEEGERETAAAETRGEIEKYLGIWPMYAQYDGPRPYVGIKLIVSIIK